MAPSTTTRCAHRVSFAFLACMVLFAVLLATGGVTYSVFKHEQVTVRTDIEKIHRDIAEHRMNANQYRAKANALANFGAMRATLDKHKSQLQDIETAQIENIYSHGRGFSLRATAAR